MGGTVRRKTILIADGDEEVRRVLAEALAKVGYQVETAERASKVIHRIQTAKIDVLIMDVGIPDIGGCEVIPIIRNIDPSIPIIILASDSSLELAKEVRKEGVFYYALKPLDLEEINLAVQDACRRVNWKREVK